MRLRKIFNAIIPMAMGAALFGCKAEGDWQGTEFAPNMYHPVAYEPLVQIDDEDAGAWLTTRDDEYGEFYGANPYNLHGMAMRRPAPNTIKRSHYEMGASSMDLSLMDSTGNTKVDSVDLMIYHYGPDELERAAAEMKNPLEKNDALLAEGQALYLRFCSHCHGGSGEGDGKVGERYKGVPSFKAGRVSTVNEGHIYHTITFGRGRMWPHGSLVSPKERWAIASYVQTLQK